MIFTIPDLLNPTELEQITACLAGAQFVDGKLTAGWHAQLVKNNQQLSKTSPTLQSLKEQVQAALLRNDLFQAAIRPKTVHSLLFSRYDVGNVLWPPHRQCPLWVALPSGDRMSLLPCF